MNQDIEKKSMNNTYKLSVIIPAFNYAHLLLQALESVFQQNEEQVQVCVVNDGSTDNTADVIQPYLNSTTLKEGRFIYLEQKNQGPSAARNNGIAHVKGEYVLFLDADDALEDGALKEIINFLTNKPEADFLIGGHYVINKKGDKKYHKADALPENVEQRFVDYIDGKISVSNGASVFRRSFFSRVKYNEALRQIEDVPVFAKALTMSYCYRCDFAFAKIFKHDDSLRNNLGLAKKTNIELLADDLFDANYLPPSLIKYKKRFYGNRCLSLFRRLYKAKQYQSARTYFYKAFFIVPVRALSWRYLSKYIRCLAKANKE